jgi:hypothetical protein
LGTEIDIRRILKYPPEFFLSAAPVDLQATDNKVAEYTGFDPYILSLQGLSFNAVDGLVFHMDVDGYTDVVKMDNLISVRGLDFEEEVKVPCARKAAFRITSSSSVSAYQWRHRVGVFKPTVALKLQLGLALTRDEEELAAKYNIPQAIAISTPEAYGIHSGIEEYRTAVAKLTSSGTVTRIPVPKGRKIILCGVSAERPSASASAYLTVDRDNIEEALKVDLYCLPSLSYTAPLRIVAIDKLEASLDVSVSGTYKVRIVYGIGRLTIREKIMWGLDLTPEEKSIADREDLANRVRAGVS